MIRWFERFARRFPNMRGRPARAAVAVALALLALPAAVAATPADTASTHAYLQARYELYLALLHSSSAGRANTEALITRLGRECRGVLIHAPGRGLEAESEESPQPPRVRGERERALHQRIVLDSELGRTLSAASVQLSRPAIESFAAATAPLSWSDARIAPLAREDLLTLQELAPASLPDVCADMKYWAQSGFRRLSPASKAFSEGLTARIGRALGGPSLETLLKPYEGAAELALVKKTEAVSLRAEKASIGDLASYLKLEHELGVPESPFEKQRRAPVLGRVPARSGGKFTIRPQVSSRQEGRTCRPAVSVEFTEKHPGGGLLSIATGSGGSVCLGRGASKQPSSTCSDGEASLRAAVPASVRTVRLRLSDGSTVTSPVVRIPPRYGGPAGVYAQAIRAAGRRLVSLTELDSEGRTVRVVRLKVPRCKREPQAAGPKIVDLVHGTTPGGTTFTIEGSLVEFSPQKPSFSVSAEAGGSAMRSEEGDTLLFGKPGSPPTPPPLQRLIGCPPHSFAIVYGLLPPPGDSVLARTPEGLIPLAKQALDPSLHAGGPLVYGAFASLPSELIVRRADGSTLYTESLVAKAKDTTEFCEGFAEP